MVWIWSSPNGIRAISTDITDIFSKIKEADNTSVVAMRYSVAQCVICFYNDREVFHQTPKQWKNHRMRVHNYEHKRY